MEKKVRGQRLTDGGLSAELGKLRWLGWQAELAGQADMLD